MCQILALNSNAPTDITFSFEGFVRRGGLTDTNVDGTGIAFFEDPNTVRIFKDDHPAFASYIRNLVKIYQVKSKNVIAHIRRASQGNRKLVNTHPFLRGLWGENWVFAHNGHVENFPGMTDEVRSQVIGETDSELFFAYLIDRLGKTYASEPSPEEFFKTVNEICDEYANDGILNFVLSNGKWQYAHCSTNLHWITRTAKQNSLVRRVDDGGIINLSRYAHEDDVVSIICTMPVTDEKWVKMKNGESVLFKDGKALYTHQGKPSFINEKYEAITGLVAAQRNKKVDYPEYLDI